MKSSASELGLAMSYGHCWSPQMNVNTIKRKCGNTQLSVRLSGPI